MACLATAPTRWRQVLQLLHRMASRKLKADGGTLSAALRCLAAPGRGPQALQLLLEHPEADAKVHAVAVKASDGWDLGLSLLELMKQRKLPTKYATSLVMAQAVSAGEWRVALELFEGSEKDLETRSALS